MKLFQVKLKIPDAPMMAMGAMPMAQTAEQVGGCRKMQHQVQVQRINPI